MRLSWIEPKKFIVIADSDSTSNQKKQECEKEYPNYKDSWFDYAVCGHNFKTLEDFYNKDYIDKELEKHGIMIDKDCKKAPMIDYIEHHTKSLKQGNEIKNTIKCNLAVNATKEDIKNEYFDFLRKLHDKISSNK